MDNFVFNFFIMDYIELFSFGFGLSAVCDCGIS